MLSGALLGCNGARNLHYFGEAELESYRTAYAEIEYSDVNPPSEEAVVYSQRPRTVKDLSDVDIWDMTLEEAMHLAMANNKMIRLQSNGTTLYANPNVAPSVYDPAIRQSGFLFGNRGVEAALADFDGQFATSLIVGRNQTVYNTGGTTISPGFVNNANTGTFTSSLGKTFATGGTFSVNHNWNYLDTNTPGLLFPSSYNGYLQAQFSQPLWGSSGVEYTRIAGPNRAGLGAVTGVSQGVVIARINEDITLSDFETSVQQMIRDVEDLYWQLFLAYRQYDAAVANVDSALRSWREVKTKWDVGDAEGRPAAEAQAREFYFESRSQVETQLNNIFQVENQFRRLLGLSVNDGRVIRPADSPLFAEYITSWEGTLQEALIRRVELRRQKWVIKSLELQVFAAQNAANPQMNFVGSYQLNGFGNDLALQGTTTDGRTNAGYQSAYGTLSRGDLTGWTMGFQFAMPIGLRALHSQLRNLELQLVKARAGLAAAELDIAHELADATQRIDLAYETAQWNLDRRIASEARVTATKAEYEAGIATATLDLVLRATASRATSEVAFYTSLVDYNRAINDLNWRRGIILDINNIHLSEGDWLPEAQEDSLRRAWDRSFAHDAPYLKTRPVEFSSPVPRPKPELSPGAPLEETVPPAPPMPAPAPEPDPAPTEEDDDVEALLR